MVSKYVTQIFYFNYTFVNIGRRDTLGKKLQDNLIGCEINYILTEWQPPESGQAQAQCQREEQVRL